VSLTQATDLGAVYRLDEVRAIAGMAKARGLKLHMDGARFANALARLGCSPAEASWRSGVDILSFGATKNGGALCDAIVVFNPEIVDALAIQLRRAGQVWSKMRFASAQLMAYIRDGLWLRLAVASNSAAGRIRWQPMAALSPHSSFSTVFLRERTASKQFAWWAHNTLLAPVEANELFLEMPSGVMDALERDGFRFYRRSATLARFVCRFDLTADETDALVAALRRHCQAPAKAAE
jgi:threonine aldolase